MIELSLHILDIVQNSLKAGASLVKLFINEDTVSNCLTIIIDDNGCGMDEEFLRDVTNPFRTTRTTRKVGMGLSMFKSAAELTGGDMHISSEVGVGTRVTANFVYNSVDRQPLGDIAATITTIISGHPEVDYIYQHSYNGEEFDFDTKQIKTALGEEISLAENDVLCWIDDYIREGIRNIYGGAQ